MENMQYLKLDNLIVDNNQNILRFKIFKFNGGEQHIVIKQNGPIEGVTIEASITSSDKLMLVFMATDALRRMGFKDINLFTPYLPYARQDRVCNEGEALSIKVLCDLINSQNYNKVYTLDNHSEVSTAILNNCVEINSFEIFKRCTACCSWGNWALVSPDAGALKKTYKLSKELGGIPVIECSKQRDVTNGKILKTIVYYDDLSMFDKLVITDDICDGGRTFLELAKVLKEKNATHIILYVSHGIFSQGVNVLIKKEEPWNGLLDAIYTTSSFINDVKIEREPFYVQDLN
jgi:ribose-phosphate pyrophosphokinase